MTVVSCIQTKEFYLTFYLVTIRPVWLQSISVRN